MLSQSSGFYGVFLERVETDLEWDVESGRGLGGLGGDSQDLSDSNILWVYSSYTGPWDDQTGRGPFQLYMK